LMSECTFRALVSWYSHSMKRSYRALVEALRYEGVVLQSQKI
jgi:hypothetical protein